MSTRWPRLSISRRSRIPLPENAASSARPSVLAARAGTHDRRTGDDVRAAGLRGCARRRRTTPRGGALQLAGDVDRAEPGDAARRGRAGDALATPPLRRRPWSARRLRTTVGRCERLTTACHAALALDAIYRGLVEKRTFRVGFSTSLLLSSPSLVTRLQQTIPHRALCDSLHVNRKRGRSHRRRFFTWRSRRLRRSTAASSNSSISGAPRASTPVAAPPRECQRGALAGPGGSGCQQAHRRLPHSRQWRAGDVPDQGAGPSVERKSAPWRRAGKRAANCRDPQRCRLGIQGQAQRYGGRAARRTRAG